MVIRIINGFSLAYIICYIACPPLCDYTPSAGFSSVVGAFIIIGQIILQQIHSRMNNKTDCRMIQPRTLIHVFRLQKSLQ